MINSDEWRATMQEQRKAFGDNYEPKCFEDPEVWEKAIRDLENGEHKD